MSEQYPTQQEYQEALNEILASAGDMIALFLEIATSGEPSKGENT